MVGGFLMEMLGELLVDWLGQISIIPTPELRGFWGSFPSYTKPQFKVTSVEVAMICLAFLQRTKILTYITNEPRKTD